MDLRREAVRLRSELESTLRVAAKIRWGGLGELTVALSTEELADELVAPEETFASMVAASPWSTHLKPRPAAAKMRAAPTSVRPAHPSPLRPKFVAHTPDPNARDAPSY